MAVHPVSHASTSHVQHASQHPKPQQNNNANKSQASDNNNTDHTPRTDKKVDKTA